MTADSLRALGERVRTRRSELGLSQLDAHAAGGPSNTTLTAIENGQAATISSGTLRKLDTALQWAPGSARRVLEGGEPTQAPSSRPVAHVAAGDPESVLHAMLAQVPGSYLVGELARRLDGGDLKGDPRVVDLLARQKDANDAEDAVLPPAALAARSLGRGGAAERARRAQDNDAER